MFVKQQQKYRFSLALLDTLSLSLVFMLATNGLFGVVDGQQSQIVTDTYLTVSGYDVSNFSVPISSFVAASVSPMAATACMYACTVAANCFFSVLNINNTCSVYSASARTSVFVLATSTIYQKKIGGSFVTFSTGPAYRPLNGYVAQNSVFSNLVSKFSCIDPVACINQCTANASCALATFQSDLQTCQLTSSNTTGQILVPSTNGSVYQKPQSGSYPTLASLGWTGFNLSIGNYWAVINGSYSDYVGGATLTPQGGVIFVPDRLGNTQGSFQTPSSSYAQAPVGIYFPGTSFSITMWLNIANLSSRALFDFCISGGSDNIVLTSNTGGTPNSFWQIYNGGSSSYVAVPVFTPGVWYHLALTYNISSLTVYVYLNGNLTMSAGSQVAIRNVTRIYNYFGYSSFGTTTFGNYMFDEIKIHGRALTAQEVLNDYAYNQSYIVFL